MRTITDKLLNRLMVQADEAKVLKKTSLVAQLDSQINKYANADTSRSDDEEYVYSYDQLKADVIASIWSGIIRTADYHNNFSIPANDTAIEAMVEKMAEELISTVSPYFGTSEIGVYEPTVPGEVREIVDLEIKE